MSNIDGLSRVDGAFPTAAELQSATIENDRIVAAIDTKTFYTTSPADEGSGLLLAGGNYANPIPAGGEVNTAGNLAGDEGVFAQKSGSDLQFKSLNAGANVTLSSDATSITIDATSGGGGEANTASNLGVGEGVFAQKNGVDLEFKSLTASGSVSLTSTASEISISSDGEANTASNLGTGEGNVFAGKVSTDLTFKTLKAGSNVSISETSTEVTINSSGGSGGTVELLTVSGQATIALGNQTWTTIDTSTSGLSVVNGITGATVSGSTVTLPAGTYEICGYTRSHLNANSGFETFARIVGSNGDVFTKSAGAGDGLGILSGFPTTSALTVSLFFELTQQTDVVFEVWASRASTSISATSMPAGQDNVLIQFVKIA